MKINKWIKNWNNLIDNESDIDLDNIEYLLDDDTNWKPIIDDNINSKIYKKFIIPVGKKSKKEAEIVISTLMKDIEWDEDTGEVNINDNIKIPYSKEFWIPSGINYGSNWMQEYASYHKLNE